MAEQALRCTCEYKSLLAYQEGNGDISIKHAKSSYLATPREVIATCHHCGKISRFKFPLKRAGPLETSSQESQ